jgi:hypothetical protein
MQLQDMALWQLLVLAGGPRLQLVLLCVSCCVKCGRSSSSIQVVTLQLVLGGVAVL